MGQPIKRSESLMPLSREHHLGLLFCWKIRQGIKFEVPKDRIARYVLFFFDKFLKDHFTEEEQQVFIYATDELAAKAVAEHSNIKSLVQKIGSDKAAKAYSDLLALADMVDDHIRFEERVLFPDIEKRVSEQELAMIGSHLSAEVLTDDYPDAFWIKNKPADNAG